MKYYALYFFILFFLSCKNIKTNEKKIFSCVDTRLTNRAEMELGIKNFDFFKTMIKIENEFIKKKLLLKNDKNSYHKFIQSLSEFNLQDIKVVKNVLTNCLSKKGQIFLSDFYGINNEIVNCSKKFPQDDFKYIYTLYDEISNPSKNINQSILNAISSCNENYFKNDKKRALMIFYIYTVYTNYDNYKKIE